MIGFLVKGRIRTKIGIRFRVRLTLAFIIGATVAGANVVDLDILYKPLFSRTVIFAFLL